MLFQWIRFPLERVFFPCFYYLVQWVKQSCKRKCQRAKWSPLLIPNFSWQWICRWRKNWACAPFPRAELKPFNQKKAEWGRKGEDKRFGSKLKNLHLFTQLILDTNKSSSYPRNTLLCNLNNSDCRKKQNWKKATRKKKKSPNFCI